MIKYLVASIIFVILDGFYINIIKPLFNSQIVSIQGSVLKPKFIAIAITYIFLLFGLNYFVLRKHMEPTDAFLYGMVIYAVYDFTNLATFSKWGLYFSVIDTFWGGTVFGLTTFIIKNISKLL